MEALGAVALHSFSAAQKQPANYNFVAASMIDCAAKMVTSIDETAEAVQM